MKKSKWPDFLFTIAVRFVCGIVFGGLACFLFAWKGILRSFSHDSIYWPLILLAGCGLAGGIVAILTLPRWQTPWYRREPVGSLTELGTPGQGRNRAGAKSVNKSVTIRTVNEHGEQHEYTSMEDAPAEVRSEIEALEKEAMQQNGEELSVTESSESGNASKEFAICEALLWEPPDGYFLLDYHLRRLEKSAVHFGFLLDVATVRERLTDYAQQLPGQPRKVRLELGASGDIGLSDENLKPSTAVRAALSEQAVQSDDEFLRHKTTRREVFERALSAHPEAQDVLLWNERGELTETCYGNVVLEIEGRRLTPPLSSGLLPGVFRAHLLDRGEIQEQRLLIRSIEAASAIFLINSVRRWCEIRLVGRSPSEKS